MLFLISASLLSHFGYACSCIYFLLLSYVCDMMQDQEEESERWNILLKKSRLHIISSSDFFFCFACVLVGGYASNVASGQGFQSDGDSSNTTVSFIPLHPVFVIRTSTLANPCFLIDICWRT